MFKTKLVCIKLIGILTVVLKFVSCYSNAIQVTCSAALANILQLLLYKFVHSFWTYINNCYWWNRENHEYRLALEILVTNVTFISNLNNYNKLSILCFSYINNELTQTQTLQRYQIGLMLEQCEVSTSKGLKCRSV